MGIASIPAPSASATETAFAAPMDAMTTTYEHIQAFTTGIYTISINPNTTNAQIAFVSDTALLTTVNTTSGSVSVQLSTAATRVYITGLDGGTPGAIITVAKTAAILTPDDIGNGTLDTINTTGTYNQTGRLAVLAFGGGAAGARGAQGYGQGGAGGASGGVGLAVVYANSATTVTIGAAGTAANTNTTNIVAPTESSFGNLLTSSTNNFFYVSGAGNGGSGYNPGNVGNASRFFTSWNGASTTGGGGGGGNTRPNGNQEGGNKAGGGSGIGTGGTSGTKNSGNSTNFNTVARGTAGTGKASGGGGGNTAPDVNSNNQLGKFGGDGSDGVVFVLRGF